MPTRKNTHLRRHTERKLEQRKKRKPAPRSRLTHELEVHEVELELQNEELADARGLLETTLARYREVFDFAPIGYVTLDGGLIREINHAGASILGAQRSGWRPFLRRVRSYGDAARSSRQSREHREHAFAARRLEQVLVEVGLWSSTHECRDRHHARR